MLQTLRNNMRHIMVVVAVSFILTIVFSWGMGGFKNKRTEVESGILGTVNGQKIMYQQFALMIDQEAKRLRESQNKESLTDYEIQSIRERVWNQVIQDILMSQEVERMGIKTTSDEIVMHLRNNPPEYIRDHEAFQTEGQFDPSKFDEALRDPANYSIWGDIENYLRSTLPIQKLSAWLISTIRVSDGEIREAYEMKNTQINAEYLYFNPFTYTVDSTEISDNAIQSYYHKNKDAFKTPEQRKIKYITFDLTPTSEDSAAVWTEAEEILQQLKDGIPFEELVSNSDDKGSAEKNGDLGFFGQGDMVKPFEEAAFNAKIGEYIGPVETSFGLHIIQVSEQKKEQGEIKIKARHILLKFESTPETYDRAYGSASYISDELMQNDNYDFNQLSEREGYQVQETPFFSEGGFIPNIGMSLVMNRIAFREAPDFISQPIKVEDNIYVFTISEIEKAHYKPLDEVRSQIFRMVMREKQKEKAKSSALRCYENIQSSDFNTAAAEDSIEIKTTGLFSYDSNIPQIGKNAVFSGTAYGLSAGDVSRVIETDRGYYIIKTIEKTTVSQSGYESEKEAIYNELLNKEMNLSYMAWIENLKKNARIEDFRESFF